MDVFMRILWLYREINTDLYPIQNVLILQKKKINKKISSRKFKKVNPSNVFKLLYMCSGYT